MSLKNIMITLALGCILLSGCASYADKHTTAAQTQTQAKPEAELIYKKTPQTDLKIYLDYPPDWKPSDRRPAIVFFGGGGWAKQSPKQFETQARYLATRGMVAARAAYRVMRANKTTPFECVEDAKSAVRWLRKNADKLGIDPKRIVASGGSAGGHMAACTYLIDELDAKNEDPTVSSKPNALVLFNPPLDLEPLFNMDPRKARNRFKDPQDAKRISPYQHLKKGVPPTLILFGTEDRLNRPLPDYMKKSKELSNRAESYIAQGARHGFFNKSPWLERTLYRTDEFLATLRYTKGKPTLKLPEAETQKASNEKKDAKAPAGQRPQVFRNLEYARPGEKSLLLDIYLPPKPQDKPLPVIVWIHGGAWRAGSK
ncbi:MAG: alpha/beta hydrolase, partial [Planctomycetota bacterium]